MIRTGGFCRSMVRICTGEVWVRSRTSSDDVEGVLHVAGGVVLRDVERLEVVVVRLHLGPVGDREAEPHEHVDDLVEDERERVSRAAHDAPAGQREVDAVGGQPGPALPLPHHLEPARERRLDLGLGLVRLPPDHRPLGGGQRGHRAEELGEEPLLAEVLTRSCSRSWSELARSSSSAAPLRIARMRLSGTARSFYRIPGAR